MTVSAVDSDLLGPLFATDPMRACFSDQARLAAMLQVEAALARAESALGLAPAALAPAIEAIDAASLDVASLGKATGIAGVPTIPFVKAVQQQLPAALEKSFHKGATTQDILDTALALQLRDALSLIAADLGPILDGLARLADAHRATPCVGRTYGQHAAPLTFGFKVAVWLTAVAESAAQMNEIRARLLVASLGGPVGTLTALGAQGPAVLDAFAADLRLAATPIAWHTSRGRIAQAGCWLVMLMGALAKFATDVAHLATTEVGEVAEPAVAGRGGSSAMPHKRNPVACTVILAAHAAAKGHAATLFDAMAGLHERPAGLWHAEWHALPTLFALASGALREARLLAEGLVVDASRMRANIDITRGLLFADSAAARLGAKLGREAAHALVEHAATHVRNSGASLLAVLSDDPAVRDTGINISAAFDLSPAIAVTGAWIDRALTYARGIRQVLAAPQVS